MKVFWLFTHSLYLLEFGGQVHFTNLGITPYGDFFRSGPPKCLGDGKRRLSNDYQLWDQISKAPAHVTVADFHHISLMTTIKIL